MHLVRQVSPSPVRPVLARVPGGVQQRANRSPVRLLRLPGGRGHEVVVVAQERHPLRLDEAQLVLKALAAPTATATATAVATSSAVVFFWDREGGALTPSSGGLSRPPLGRGGRRVVPLGLYVGVESLPEQGHIEPVLVRPGYAPS